MMARWMLAASLFGVLVSVATLALDRVLRAQGRETRGVWSVTLVVSLVWPLVAALALRQPVAPANVTIGQAVAVGATPTPAMSWWQVIVPDASPVNTTLQVLWAMASVLLLVQAARAVRCLRMVERESIRATLGGEPVLVSTQLGPAVFGLRKPRVVVPHWLLDLEPSLQAMVLRHEREHCTGGDPWLVWLAVVATIIMPWNVAVWFAASRMRLAMELDCDMRTLRAMPAREDAYARLLLLIAQRSTRARYVPALAHSPSQLARRIAAMTTKPKVSITQRTLALTLATGALAAACSRTVAGNLAGPALAPQTVVTAPLDTAPQVDARALPTELPKDAPYFEFQVEKPVSLLPGARGPEYPPALRAEKKEGRVLVQYIVNANGEIEAGTIKVLQATDSAFAAAVRAVLPSLRYAPALVGGRAVKQVVQAPFMFSLGRDAATPRDGAKPEANGLNAPSDSANGQQASLLPAFKGPVYPDALRAEQIEGQVLIQIVVNADGTADMPSLRVLKSDHPLFTESVKSALSAARFRPATVKGRAVRQLMQLPFSFNVPKD